MSRAIRDEVRHQSLHTLSQKVSNIRPQAGPRSQCGPFFNWMCLSVTLLIVDPWQYYVYCIRSGGRDPMQPQYDALLYVCTSADYTRCFGPYRYTDPCRTSQYHSIFIPLSESLWNDLADPVFEVWDWRDLRAGPFFYWPKLLGPLLSYCFPFFFFLSIVGIVGLGFFTDRV